jgi:hypothetical protein
MAKPVIPVIKEPKKPYSPPLLLVYGTVRDLTQAQGRNGKLDRGGRGQNIKTHF